MHRTSKTLYKLLSAYVSGVVTGELFVLQYRGHKHDERDVEGEAIAVFRAVNREDLIGVGCYWREYEAEQTFSASYSHLEKGEHTTRVRSNRRGERVFGTCRGFVGFELLTGPVL
jgi:hypothetical protein